MTGTHPGTLLTGVGAIAPTGTDTAGFLRGLTEGFATAAEPGRLIAQHRIEEPKLRISRYLDPVSQYAIVATRRAMEDAGIHEERIATAPHGYGVVLGTLRGPCTTRRALHESLLVRQGKTVSGTLFSHAGYNIAAAMTAVAFGMRGPNLTLMDPVDTGGSVVRAAERLIAAGRAHTVFAGAAECDPCERLEFGFVVCLERRDVAEERGAKFRVNLAPETECGPSLPFGDRYRSLFLLGLRSLRHRLEPTTSP